MKLNTDEIQLVRLALQNYQNSLSSRFEMDSRVCKIMSLPEENLASIQHRIAEVQNLLEIFSGEEPKNYPVKVICQKCGKQQLVEDTLPTSFICKDQHIDCEVESQKNRSKLIEQVLQRAAKSTSEITGLSEETCREVIEKASEGI